MHNLKKVQQTSKYFFKKSEVTDRENKLELPVGRGNIGVGG